MMSCPAYGYIPLRNLESNTKQWKKGFDYYIFRDRRIIEMESEIFDRM